MKKTKTQKIKELRIEILELQSDLQYSEHCVYKLFLQSKSANHKIAELEKSKANLSIVMMKYFGCTDAELRKKITEVLRPPEKEFTSINPFGC